MMTRRKWWLMALTVALVAIAGSAIGLRNGFAFDDVYVVGNNARVHTLSGLAHAFRETYWPQSAGADGYRPLTIIAFALEWAVGHGAPWVFHAVNIALNAGVAVLVWWIATMLLPAAWAFATAVLFAVHPVHSEAVANVVGQSELWVAFLLVLAVGLYLQARRSGDLSAKRWGAIALLYASACLFKEHALVLPALLVMAELTVIADPRPVRARIGALRPGFLALVAIALTVWWVRGIVRGGDAIGFAPLVSFETLQISAANRVLTAVGVVPVWVRLFVWPARLAIDYSPGMVDIAQGLKLTQLPGFVLLLGIIALGFLARRKQPVLSFGIGWLVVALLPASNFIVPAGFVVAERTLYLPSVGALLAMVCALALLVERLSTPDESGSPARGRLLTPAGMAGAVVVALVLLGGWHTTRRTTIWRDNASLFATEVRAHPDNYRLNLLYANTLSQKGRNREAIAPLRRALDLFPYDPSVSIRLGEVMREVHGCEPAIPYFHFALKLNPDSPSGRFMLTWCYYTVGKVDSARASALEGMRRSGGGAGFTMFRRELTLIDSLVRHPRRPSAPALGEKPAGGPVPATGKVPTRLQNTAAN